MLVGESPNNQSYHLICTTLKTMENLVCVPNTCHISLKEILELHGHPITEEQAWALCYQLCTLLRNCTTESVGPIHKERPQTPRLPGAEGILFSNDGSVCLKGIAGNTCSWNGLREFWFKVLKSLNISLFFFRLVCFRQGGPGGYQGISCKYSQADEQPTC